MDWVKGNQVQPSVIEADMAGLPGFESFKDDINSCSAWSGNFGGRKKRDLGSEDEEVEEVPSVMESGNGPLQWVRSLLRNVRSAEPDKENKRNARKGKGKGKGKKGRRRRAAKGTREGITRKREEATRKMAKKAARRMTRKVIKQKKMITTQARKKDEAERIRSCCPSSFTINSGASTWPWNRLSRGVWRTSCNSKSF